MGVACGWHGGFRCGIPRASHRIVTAKGQMKRAALIATLNRTFPGMKCRLGEDFSADYRGAIWTGEDAPDIDGNPMFNHYGFDVDPHERVWTLGIHNALRDVLDQAGWHAEFHDPGTVFIFNDN